MLSSIVFGVIIGALVTFTIVKCADHDVNLFITLVIAAVFVLCSLYILHKLWLIIA